MDDAQWRWEPRVLVVDDDGVCQLAARRLFKNLGIAADVVADGAHAVKASGEWPYVAVFMDCGTEAVDGYRTARQIRARDGLDHSPPVIAVTSLSREVCLASGMDHHIAKPLRLETLQAECERLGLIPRPGTTTEPAAARGGSPVSLLEPPAGLGTDATAERAAAFAHDVLPVLPSLWRTANIGDLERLERTASDLARRATDAGAARVAALCRALGDAAAGGHTDAAAELEPAVRQALRLTAGAARTQLESASGPAATATAAEPDPASTLVRVVIAADGPDAYLAMLRAGASGLLVKGGSAERLVEMIHRAHASAA